MNKIGKIIISISALSITAIGAFFAGKSIGNKKTSDAITVLAQDTSEEEDSWGITNHSLGLSDTIYLVYCVQDTEAKETGDQVDVYVWRSYEDANECVSPDYICESYIDPKQSSSSYDLYLLKGLGYKNLVDRFYAREVRTSSLGVKTYSDIDDYSMIKYCGNHYDDVSVAYNGSFTTLGDLIKDIVHYATTCQKYFNYRTDHLASEYLYCSTDPICSFSFDYHKLYFDSVSTLEKVIDGNDYLNATLHITFTEEVHINLFTVTERSNNNSIGLYFKSGSTVNSLLIKKSVQGNSTLRIDGAEIERIESISNELHSLYLTNCVLSDCVVLSNVLGDIKFENCSFKETFKLFCESSCCVTFDRCLLGEGCGIYNLFEFTDCQSIYFVGCQFFQTDISIKIPTLTNVEISIQDTVPNYYGAVINIISVPKLDYQHIEIEDQGHFEWVNIQCGSID